MVDAADSAMIRKAAILKTGPRRAACPHADIPGRLLKKVAGTFQVPSARELQIIANGTRRGCDFFESEESTHHAPRDVASKTKGF